MTNREGPRAGPSRRLARHRASFDDGFRPPADPVVLHTVGAAAVPGAAR